MNELQLALIGLGATAVGGVVAYNKWQERRHRQVAEALLTPHRGDPLFDGVGGDALMAERTPAPAPQSAGMAGFTAFGAAPETVEALSRPTAGEGRAAAAMPERDERGGALPPPSLETPRQEPSLGGLSALNAVPDHMPSEPVLASAAAAPAPPPVPDYVAPPFAAAPIAAPLLRPDSPRGPIALDDQPEAPLAPLPASEAPPVSLPSSSFSAVLLPPELLSTDTDYLVALETAEALPAQQWMEAQREALGRLSKAVIWVGFDEREGVWTPLEADDSRPMRRLRVGLQLADRRGPVAEHELAAFHAAMRQVAERFMAVADLPLQRNSLETAQELDAFCAQVDIQIGLNVIAQQHLFAGTKIRALAESAGMALEASGAFVRRDDLGRAVYALIGHDPGGFAADSMKTLQSRGFTFLLDVPRIAHGDRVFLQVVELARRFADTLHGKVVDDNGQPFTDAMIEPIRRQIVQYQTAMATRGIPAGGPVALRLFA